MASEETFQSYEKGTHVPTVQKSRWMLFNVSRINMFTFKYSKRKKWLFYLEGIDKTLSDVMKHHVSLRKSSKYNDWVSYLNKYKKPKK